MQEEEVNYKVFDDTIFIFIWTLTEEKKRKENWENKKKKVLVHKIEIFRKVMNLKLLEHQYLSMILIE